VAEEAEVETKEKPKGRRRVKSEISAKVRQATTIPTDSLVPNIVRDSIRKNLYLC
jgi:hypothetical protein